MVLKVAVFWTSRSEEGLLAPVINELRNLGIEVLVHSTQLRWDPEVLNTYYKVCYEELKNKRPDLVFASFDRPEMLIVAQAAHYLNILVAQIGAGDVSLKGAWDDRIRWSISALADLVFCNGETSFKRALEVRGLQQGKSWGWIWEKDAATFGVYEVGSTAFDDIEIDDHGVRPRTAVVLYNPPTTRPDLIQEELSEIKSHLIHLHPDWVEWIRPNGDPGSNVVEGRAREILHEVFEEIPSEGGGRAYSYHETLPRPRYLGLLRKAEWLIGNSSSFFLEAPTLRGWHRDVLEEGDMITLRKGGLPAKYESDIIHVGVRNRGREYVYARKGGSKRIAEIIKEYLETRMIK